MRLVLHGRETGVRTKKKHKQEISTDGLRTLRGGLLLQFEADFIHPKGASHCPGSFQPPWLD